MTPAPTLRRFTAPSTASAITHQRLPTHFTTITAFQKWGVGVQSGSAIIVVAKSLVSYDVVLL